MRPELRHLYAVRWCDAEVCNGGFHQFYTNATGVLGPEAAEGFEAVGLPACAEIVRGTLAFFGAPFPRERAQRMTQLPTRGKTRAEWDPFTKADQGYYAAIGKRHVTLLEAADAYAARWLAS